jgi:predicted transcriptional regulator
MRDYTKRQQDEAEHDVWFRQQVQAGLDSANAGNLVAADDIESEFTARREETRRKLRERLL